jgi:hypothetical protein
MTIGRMIYFISMPKDDYWEDDILHVCTKAMSTGKMIYFMLVQKL